MIRLAEDGHVSLFTADLDGCPAKFTLAFPTRTGPDDAQWRHAWGFSGGRGLSIEDALLGALGEAAECMSAWSRADIDPLIVPRSAIPPGSAVLDAARLLNLSHRQLLDLRTRTMSFAEPHPPLELQSDDFSNRFLQFQDKNTKKSGYIPSLCALLNEEPYYGLFGERLTSTNGTAVAACFSTASDKAMFELVERDSVSIWWYNRIEREILPPALVEACCGCDLGKWLAARLRRFHVLDLSADLEVPVAGALSYEPDGSMIADGYAAGRTWPEAILSAVLEMLQAEMSLGFMQQKADRDAAVGGTAEKSAFFEETKRMNLYREGFMAGRPGSRPAAAFDREINADEVLDRMRRGGIEIFVADVTRADIGIPAARAVSPQLRDWRPRFGPGRLYDVPPAMGWLDAPNSEDSLNPRAFLS